MLDIGRMPIPQDTGNIILLPVKSGYPLWELIGVWDNPRISSLFGIRTMLLNDLFHLFCRTDNYICQIDHLLVVTSNIVGIKMVIANIENDNALIIAFPGYDTGHICRCKVRVFQLFCENIFFLRIEMLAEYVYPWNSLLIGPAYLYIISQVV